MGIQWRKHMTMTSMDAANGILLYLIFSPMGFRLKNRCSGNDEIEVCGGGVD